MSGPNTRLSGPDTQLSGPNTRLSGPDTQLSGPNTRLSGPDAELTGPAVEVAVAGPIPAAHPGWELVGEVPGVQFVDDWLRAEPFEDARALTAADVPEILDLIERTQPGPFRTRTIELGTYLGVRRNGRLIAMAGERLHPPGWTEISAVCTDPAFRGQGLATKLVRAVAFGVRQRGEIPFLHTSAANTNAIRLYQSIGFRLRKRTTFALYRAL
ncbi:GNAT family N-acetyltransferase [Actinoplanes bogorensis]|uniref:GNAT family N-acetyltransferase n=1 Tax=Paractinoplanes bogorensis TaxID=1610840 RepID=A0ABS5Z8I2_9ACTN|nr:GNAT family N-acetyltransferase [Actinoplanes bogorensis]